MVPGEGGRGGAGGPKGSSRQLHLVRKVLSWKGIPGPQPKVPDLKGQLSPVSSAGGLCGALLHLGPGPGRVQPCTGS